MLECNGNQTVKGELTNTHTHTRVHTDTHTHTHTHTRLKRERRMWRLASHPGTVLRAGLGYQYSLSKERSLYLSFYIHPEVYKSGWEG